MGINKKNLEKFLEKFFLLTKPKDVIKIDFKLTSASPAYFYMDILYVVPDNSPHLKVKKPTDYSADPRTAWNVEVTKSIRGYFDVTVIITQTGITSESFYNQQKEREKSWQKN